MKANNQFTIEPNYNFFDFDTGWSPFFIVWIVPAYLCDGVSLPTAILPNARFIYSIAKMAVTDGCANNTTI